MGGVGGTERDEIDHVLGRLLGLDTTELTVLRVEPLLGWTNRNYKVVTPDGVLALRIPRPGTGAYIDRAAELDNARQAAALGVNAEVVAAEADGTMISGFIAGIPMDAERFRCDEGAVQRAGRTMARVHTAAGRFRGRFDPIQVIARHRAALGADRDVLSLDELLAEVRARGYGVDEVPLVPSHNDTWPCNFIDTGREMRLLDWEYSGMNDAAWDLADFSVECGLDDRAEAVLLGAYADGEPSPDLASRVVATKALTDILWAAWALVQDADGNPVEDFPAYAAQRLERARVALD